MRVTATFIHITLIYQIDAGCRRLLWVGERRTEACLRAGMCHLGAALQEVKYVCSDMWRPYLKVIASLLPQALNILDKFHIVARLNAAVDSVRRAEVTRLGGSKESAAGSRLKKMRWNLLRAGRRVRGKARVRLKALIRAKGATARAWMLGDELPGCVGGTSAAQPAGPDAESGPHAARPPGVAGQLLQGPQAPLKRRGGGAELEVQLGEAPGLRPA